MIDAEDARERVRGWIEHLRGQVMGGAKREDAWLPAATQLREVFEHHGELAWAQRCAAAERILQSSWLSESDMRSLIDALSGAVPEERGGATGQPDGLAASVIEIPTKATPTPGETQESAADEVDEGPGEDDGELVQKFDGHMIQAKKCEPITARAMPDGEGGTREATKFDWCNGLYKSGLGTARMYVGFLLALYANLDGTRSKPSQVRLARQSNLKSERAIRDSINSLIRGGWLRIVGREGKRNVYQLMAPLGVELGYERDDD